MGWLMFVDSWLSGKVGNGKFRSKLSEMMGFVRVMKLLGAIGNVSVDGGIGCGSGSVGGVSCSVSDASCSCRVVICVFTFLVFFRSSIMS